MNDVFGPGIAVLAVTALLAGVICIASGFVLGWLAS